MQKHLRAAAERVNGNSYWLLWSTRCVERPARAILLFIVVLADIKDLVWYLLLLISLEEWMASIVRRFFRAVSSSNGTVTGHSIILSDNSGMHGRPADHADCLTHASRYVWALASDVAASMYVVNKPAVMQDYADNRLQIADKMLLGILAN